jgi:hypothetical protein
MRALQASSKLALLAVGPECVCVCVFVCVCVCESSWLVSEDKTVCAVCASGHCGASCSAVEWSTRAKVSKSHRQQRGKQDL